MTSLDPDGSARSAALGVRLQRYRDGLLGDPPAPAPLEELSNETHVTEHTPPTFLFHTAEDPAVSVENSLTFASALHAVGVPVELHVFPKGPHGVGLAPHDPALSQWPKLCATWLKAMGYLDAAPTRHSAVRMP